MTLYRYLRAFIRFTLFGINLSGYFVTSFPFALLANRYPMAMRKILTRVVSLYCYITTKIFRVKVKVTGNKEYLDGRENYFFVSNHLTYMDIFIFSSVVPACYVTSIEMKKTPLLGHAAQAAGSLYTERRNRDNIMKEIQMVTNGLKNNLNVFVFPEATSTNGEEVIMFRKSMFNAPIQAQTKILPFTINYRSLGGEELHLGNRDSIFWYGDMGFPGSFIDVLLHDYIEVDIHVHEPVMPDKDHCPMELANHVHSIVASKYVKVNR